MNYVQSGCVWTGDSYGSTLHGSMTSGVVWINNVQLTVAAITAHSFAASSDTYVDFQNNGNGTASVSYTAVANNAASPALANSGTSTNTIRDGIIVTGASSIAGSADINQGSIYATVPASSVTNMYAVSDSIGNRIYPTNPNGGLIGYRQYTTNFTTTSTTQSLVNIPVPVIIPAGRTVKITVGAGYLSNTVGGNANVVAIYDITAGGIGAGAVSLTAGEWGGLSVAPLLLSGYDSPSSSGLRKFDVGFSQTGTGGATLTIGAGLSPYYVAVELQ